MNDLRVITITEKNTSKRVSTDKKATFSQTKISNRELRTDLMQTKSKQSNKNMT